MEAKAIRKVVIPIAGFGTRMFPGSKIMPKALFPILDPVTGFQKPILQVIIEQAVDSLAAHYLKSNPNYECKVCVVLSPSQKPLIEEYFFQPLEQIPKAYRDKKDCAEQIAKIERIAKNLTLVEQREQAGYGDAIFCAKEFVGKEPFMILIGDHVYTSSHPQKLPVVQQIIEAYETYCNQSSGKSPFKNLTTLDTCSIDELSTNGILKMANLITPQVIALEKTVEKPTIEQVKEHDLQLTHSQQQTLGFKNTEKQQFLCYFGIEILNFTVFGILESMRKQVWEVEKKELQLRDPMCQLMLNVEQEGMIGFIVQGARHDTGLPLAYAESMYTLLQEYHALQNKQ